MDAGDLRTDLRDRGFIFLIGVLSAIYGMLDSAQIGARYWSVGSLMFFLGWRDALPFHFMTAVAILLSIGGIALVFERSTWRWARWLLLLANLLHIAGTVTARIPWFFGSDFFVYKTVPDRLGGVCGVLNALVLPLMVILACLRLRLQASSPGGFPVIVDAAQLTPGVGPFASQVTDGG